MVLGLRVRLITMYCIKFFGVMTHYSNKLGLVGITTRSG